MMSRMTTVAGMVLRDPHIQIRVMTATIIIHKVGKSVVVSVGIIRRPAEFTPILTIACDLA